MMELRITHDIENDRVIAVLKGSPIPLRLVVVEEDTRRVGDWVFLENDVPYDITDLHDGSA